MSKGCAELSPPLAMCSSQKSWLRILRVGELSLPLTSSSTLLGNTVEMALMGKTWMSQPQSHESQRAGLAHLLQHLGEWARHVDWEAQWSWRWCHVCQ